MSTPPLNRPPGDLREQRELPFVFGFGVGFLWFVGPLIQAQLFDNELTTSAVFLLSALTNVVLASMREKSLKVNRKNIVWRIASKGVFLEVEHIIRKNIW